MMPYAFIAVTVAAVRLRCDRFRPVQPTNRSEVDNSGNSPSSFQSRGVKETSCAAMMPLHMGFVGRRAPLQRTC
jgi:hypothetical protein